MNKNTIIQEALESISVKNTSKLGAIIEKGVIAGKKDGLLKGLKSVEKDIFKESGLNVKFSVKNFDNAYCMIPGLSETHVLYESFFEDTTTTISSRILPSEKEIINGLKKPEDIVRGTVDLNKVKLSGVFSKIPARITVGSKLMNYLSAAEMTAIILHELGHFFTFCLHSADFIRTNYILKEYGRLNSKQWSREHTIAFFKKAEDIGHNVLDSEDLKDISNGATATLVVIKQQLNMHSEIGKDPYSRRTAEMLADQFSARLGYGKSLAVSISKLQKLFGNALDLTLGTTSLIGALGLLIMKVFGIYILALSTIFASMAFLSIIIFVFMTLAGLISGDDYQYDTKKIRIEAILRQISNMLKDSNLDKEIKKAYLNDISEIEANSKVFDGVFVEWGGVISTMGNYMPWNLKRLKSVKIQQELEKLANNRYSEAASRLEI